MITASFSERLHLYTVNSILLYNYIPPSFCALTKFLIPPKPFKFKIILSYNSIFLLPIPHYLVKAFLQKKNVSIIQFSNIDYILNLELQRIANTQEVLSTNFNFFANLAPSLIVISLSLSDLLVSTHFVYINLWFNYPSLRLEINSFSTTGCSHSSLVI